jgi:hypothetical protein
METRCDLFQVRTELLYRPYYLDELRLQIVKINEHSGIMATELGY